MSSTEALAQAQQAAESDRHDEQRRDAMFTQFVKGCLVLNGGGVIAVLGLLQSLAGKDQNLAEAFKTFGVCAAGLFLAGSVFAALSFWVIFRASMSHEIGGAAFPRWLYFLETEDKLPLASALIFVIGAVAAIAGVYHAI